MEFKLTFFPSQLENIGAEDILDRNERLILGLIWTIILRFQIDTIVIDVVSTVSDRSTVDSDHELVFFNFVVSREMISDTLTFLRHLASQTDDRCKVRESDNYSVSSTVAGRLVL